VNERDELVSQLQRMFKKADRSISAARRHIKEDDCDFASSRAYYAAFYSLQAVLLTRDLSFSKHAGVISGFNQHFVKTAIFPKNFSKLISRLFRHRQSGDYDFGSNISTEDAERDVRTAEEIRQSISEYLKREGFLD